MQPLVSIIIPTFNRGYCLGRAIQSVVLQTFESWELIIIDNYSTDNTKLVVDSFKDRRIFFLTIYNNGIVAASRNRGLSLSKGKYVAFLDSDDWWAPDKLEKSVLVMDNGADLSYHDLYIASHEDVNINLGHKCKTRFLKAPIFDDLMLYGNAINTSSVLIRRELMIKIGGFSEIRELIAAEDFDAWLRLSKVTDKFQRVCDCLGYYMIGGNSLSSIERTIVYLKHLNKLYGGDVFLRTNQLPIWIHVSLCIAYFRDRKYLSALAVFFNPILWRYLPRYSLMFLKNKYFIKNDMHQIK